MSGFCQDVQVDKDQPRSFPAKRGGKGVSGTPPLPAPSSPQGHWIPLAQPTHPCGSERFCDSFARACAHIGGLNIKEPVCSVLERHTPPSGSAPVENTLHTLKTKRLAEHQLKGAEDAGIRLPPGTEVQPRHTPLSQPVSCSQNSGHPTSTRDVFPKAKGHRRDAARAVQGAPAV